jgi:tRNA threonylcarbamoyladenosine biosynthesis protein TsaE
MGRERIGAASFLATEEETRRFGSQLSLSLRPGSILALTGGLGAGKTTLVQGVLTGLGSSDHAQSPTFPILQIYEASPPLYHFDLYRLAGQEEFVRLGLSEFLFGNGVAVVEWAERIQTLIPPDALWIALTPATPTGRTVTIQRWRDYGPF